MNEQSWIWGLRRFFYRKYWQQRKALRILHHARFHLNASLDRYPDWDATGILVKKLFEVIKCE